MPKSPDALRSSLSKTAAKSAATGSRLGSSVGPSQNMIVRTETASFGSVALFRASPALADGTVFACDDRLWQYDASITNADDGVNYLKPTAVAADAPGRAKALSTGATPFGPFSSIAAFRAATPPSVDTEFDITDVGHFLYRASAGANFEDNNTTILKPDAVLTASNGRAFLLADGTTQNRCPPDVPVIANPLPPDWFRDMGDLTGLIYLDPAGIAATANGNVATWEDAFGGTSATEPASGAGPELVIGGCVTGGSHAVFTAANTNALSCNSVATGATRPFTLVWVGTVTGLSATHQTLVGMSTGGDFQLSVTSTGVRVSITDQAAATATITKAIVLDETMVHHIAVVVNGSSSFLYVDGSLQTGNLTVAGTWSPTLCSLGALPGRTAAMSGTLRGFAAYNGVANFKQISRILTGITGRTPTVVTLLGDSHFSDNGDPATKPSGTALIAAPLWTTQLFGGWDGGNGYHLNVYGVPGDDTYDVLARVNTVRELLRGRVRHVVVISVGANDLLGVDVNTFMVNLTKICERLRKRVPAGYIPPRVVICTTMPRIQEGTVGGARRKAYAAAEMLKGLALCDGIIRPEYVPGLDVAKIQQYPGGLWNDGTHLRAEGGEQYARAIGEWLRRIEAESGVSVTWSLVDEEPVLYTAEWLHTQYVTTLGARLLAFCVPEDSTVDGDNVIQSYTSRTGPNPTHVGANKNTRSTTLGKATIFCPDDGAIRSIRFAGIAPKTVIVAATVPAVNFRMLASGFNGSSTENVMYAYGANGTWSDENWTHYRDGVQTTNTQTQLAIYEAYRAAATLQYLDIGAAANQPTTAWYGGHIGPIAAVSDAITAGERETLVAATNLYLGR